MKRKIYFMRYRRKKGKKNGEKSAKENIFCGGEEKRRRKGRKIFGEVNIFSTEAQKNREGKGGKYLETEKIYFSGIEENGERKGGGYLEKENRLLRRRRRGKTPGIGRY